MSDSKSLVGGAGGAGESKRESTTPKPRRSNAGNTSPTKAQGGDGASSFLDMMENKDKKDPIPYDGSTLAILESIKQAIVIDSERFGRDKLLSLKSLDILVNAIEEFERALVRSYTDKCEHNGRPLLLPDDPIIQEMRDLACKKCARLQQYITMYTLKSKTAGEMFRGMGADIAETQEAFEDKLERLADYEANVMNAVDFSATEEKASWPAEALLWSQEKRCKVELHCHLEGSVPTDSLFRLQACGILPTSFASQAAAAAALVLDGRRSDPEEMLELYQLHRLAFTYPSGSRNITRDVVLQNYAKSVMLLEMRFCPYLITEEVSSSHDIRDRPYPREWDDHFQAMLEGRDLGLESAPGMVAGFVVVARRDYGARGCMMTAKFAERWRPHLCGFDLAGVEGKHRLDGFKPATDVVHKIGLPLTLHVGQGTPARTIHDCITLYAPVRRISHAISAPKDRFVIDRMRKESITLELCPTSDYCSGLATDLTRHPAKDVLRQGVPVAVCTDYPGMLGTTLEAEWATCLVKLGMDKRDLLEMARHAVNATFLPECPFIAEDAKVAVNRALEFCDKWEAELEAQAAASSEDARYFYKRVAQSYGHSDDSSALSGERAASLHRARTELNPSRAFDEFSVVRKLEEKAFAAAAAAASVAARNWMTGAKDAAEKGDEAAREAYQVCVRMAGASPDVAKRLGEDAARLASGSQQANLMHFVHQLKTAIAKEAEYRQACTDAHTAIKEAEANVVVKVAELKAASEAVKVASQVLLDAHLAKKAEANAALLVKQSEQTDAINARSAASVAVERAKEHETDMYRALAAARDAVDQGRRNVLLAITVAEDAGVEVAPEIVGLANRTREDDEAEAAEAASAAEGARAAAAARAAADAAATDALGTP